MVPGRGVCFPRGGGRFSDWVLGGVDDILIAENQEKTPPLPVTNECSLKLFFLQIIKTPKLKNYALTNKIFASLVNLHL